MKERWLNGCLIKPTEDGGWHISLGIHTQTFKTRSKAVQFALSVRANGPADHGTTGPESETQGLSKNRLSARGWVPQCITGGGRARKVTKADDYAIIERMFHGCLVDEMGNGTWRVQYQTRTPRRRSSVEVSVESASINARLRLGKRRFLSLTLCQEQRSFTARRIPYRLWSIRYLVAKHFAIVVHFQAAEGCRKRIE